MRFLACYTSILSLIVCSFAQNAYAETASFDPIKKRFEERFGFLEENVEGFENIKQNPFKYKGIPLHIGTFLVSPNLTFEQKYTDNILALENNKKSDLISVVRPELKIEKEISRHKFRFQANGEVKKYAENSDEDVINMRSSFLGLIEAHHTLTIPISLRYESNHFDRKDQRASRSTITKDPLAFKRFEVASGMVYKPNRLSLQLIGRHTQRRFENASLLNGTASIREDRDFDSNQVEAEIAYSTSTNWAPYVEVLYGQDKYLRRNFNGTSFSGIKRDNSLIRLLGGTKFDYKGLIYGNFGVGWEKRNYKDESVEDADSLSLNANLYWQPISKMRLNLKLLQETQEDNDVAEGIKKFKVDTTIDYELQRDLFASIGLSYTNNDFFNSNQEDDVYEGGLKLQYIISPHFQLGAEYLYEERASNQPDLSFDRNTFMLRATGAL